MAMQIISRDEAHQQGKKLYYTGKPCRVRGHLAQRYVINGCCKACLTGMYKQTFGSGYTHDLVSFRPQKLVAPATATREQLITLRHYLQTCIFAFVAKNMPEAMTDGTIMAMNMHGQRSPDIHNNDELP
jgi:hypothetical protein